MTLSRELVARLERLLEHPAILPGLLLAGAIFVAAQVIAANSGQPFAVYDAHSYWLAGGSDHPYAATIASGFDGSLDRADFRRLPRPGRPLGPVAAALSADAC